MSENKNTLAKGMFVREHTFNSGTKVINVSINIVDFCAFAKEHINEDTNGTKWVNLKFIPNSNVGENKLTHTPILNDYYTNSAEQAMEELAAETLTTTSAAERKITEAPAKKTRKKASRKTAKSDDLPF